MSPVRLAPGPRRPLYRLGWLPDPLEWLPWERVGDGRFDDPRQRFRVLYAAGQRRGVFLETLATLRPTVEFLARLSALGPSAEQTMPTIAADWYARRGVARLRLRPRQRWLDLRRLETREAVRAQMAGTLLELGSADLDVASVTGPVRELTQTVARWAYERGYAGLAYRSRLDETLTLWAVFEGAAFEAVGHPEPIGPDDPDLVATARLFGLRI